MQNISIAVIGGGAAGMMAAIEARAMGAAVTLFEKNKVTGRKLAITGKGRCNVTNDCDVRTLLENVPRNPRFLYSCVNAFPPEKIKEYFESLGVPLKTERGNRVFPVSDKASDIVGALNSKMKSAGVLIKTAEEVKALVCENGEIKGLRSAKGEYTFDKVILATGGLSYPATGSDGDGFRMARDLSIPVTDLRPSLVPLTVKEKYCAEMMGLSLKNTALKLIDQKKNKVVYEDFGEMLFTHFGVSGPMILSASSHMESFEAGRYVISLDIKPALDEKALDRRILSDFAKFSNRDFSNSLGELLPRKMIGVVISIAGIPAAKKVNEISREERAKLVSTLKDMRFTITGARPIDEAIITSGGIDTSKIDPKTMESKLVRGLFFAGEMIDVDAYTGGFNLSIAFATAVAAAKGAVEGRSENGKEKEKEKDKKKKDKEKGRKKMLNIAIDGPAGAGKSYLSDEIAKKYSLIHVDTGALYRTVGVAADRAGIAPEDKSGIVALLDKIDVSMKFVDGSQRAMLCGEDVTAFIREPKISMLASAVSAIPEVRAFLLEAQRRIARENPVIMDGRDIGTVILPNADVKIFLEASNEARAKRRYLELCEKGVATTYEEVLADMTVRDRNDSTRATAPLTPAADAVHLDNSSLSREESVEAALAIIKEKIGY